MIASFVGTSKAQGLYEGATASVQRITGPRSTGPKFSVYERLTTDLR
jgi:hypothetical protein